MSVDILFCILSFYELILFVDGIYISVTYVNYDYKECDRILFTWINAVIIVDVCTAIFTIFWFFRLKYIDNYIDIHPMTQMIVPLVIQFPQIIFSCWILKINSNLSSTCFDFIYSNAFDLFMCLFLHILLAVCIFPFYCMNILVIYQYWDD